MTKLRTQIYLDSKQRDLLDDIAYSLRKQTGRKTSISELIREGIELLKQEYQIIDETDIIINSPILLDGIEKARKEKGFLTHKEVFGDK